MARDVRMELDPAMGYGTWAPPDYVKDFADLAISGMQSKLEDRPAGEAVMAKLVAILSQCGIRINDASSGIRFGNSLLGDLDYNPRTSASLPNISSCVFAECLCSVQVR